MKSIDVIGCLEDAPGSSENEYSKIVMRGELALRSLYDNSIVVLDSNSENKIVEIKERNRLALKQDFLFGFYIGVQEYFDINSEDVSELLRSLDRDEIERIDKEITYKFHKRLRWHIVLWFSYIILFMASLLGFFGEGLFIVAGMIFGVSMSLIIMYPMALF